MTEPKNSDNTQPVRQTPETRVIRLKVINAETGESRFCGPEEAKAWNWSDASMMRMIGGWQIASFDRLLFMMQEKGRKGVEVVELIEIPRFMVLSGG